MKHFWSLKRILLFALSWSLVGLTVINFVPARQLMPVRPSEFDITWIPYYPGAQQVESWAAEKAEDDPYDGFIPYRTVTFVTTDSPHRVFAFYKDALNQPGFEDWLLDSYEQEIGNTLGILRIYGFVPGMTIASPMFIFAVKTEKKGGYTHVTVERSYVPGM